MSAGESANLTTVQQRQAGGGNRWSGGEKKGASFRSSDGISGEMCVCMCLGKVSVFTREELRRFGE